MLHDEGYVKFQVVHIAGALPSSVPAELLSVRDQLHRMGLMGIYPDGIGFGNVSMRVVGTDQFLITGTQTGGIYPLTSEGLCLVTQVDIQANRVHCTGPVAASSESMTHAACYMSRSDTMMVIHVHHAGMWTFWMHMAPTVSADITYGTPEMANAIAAVCRTGSAAGLIVAAGHTDGLFVYGPDAEIALTVLLQHYTTWSANRG